MMHSAIKKRLNIIREVTSRGLDREENVEGVGIIRALLPSRLVSIHDRLFRYPNLSVESTGYDEYWENKRGQNMGTTNAFQSYRAHWIASRIKAGDCVLDIGAGDGAVLSILRKTKQVDAIGVDVSEKAVAFLNEQGFRTIHADLKELSAITSLPEADHVTLLEVLEHISDPEGFLTNIMKKSKQSVFFSFPNTGYVMHRMRLLFGRFPLQWRVHPSEHIRFWTLNDLKWWLNSIGLLEHATIHVYEGVPGLNRLWKGLFGAAFIVQIDTTKVHSNGESY